MRTTVKISVTIIVILSLAFWWQSRQQLKQLQLAFKQSAEEPLVDLAVLLANNFSLNFPDVSKIDESINLAKNFNFETKIYDFNKSNFDLRIYITDLSGIVIYDSLNQDLKADYSKWNDIILALQGKIGVRSSKDNNSRTQESTIYVAAPIIQNSKIVGALSVGKPTRNLNLLIRSAYSSASEYLAVTFLLIASVSLLLIYFIIAPVTALKKYALAVRDGENLDIPKLPQGEIHELGEAFSQMKQALDGRKYAEKYIQTLTHEMKSPITAITGAAEILSDEISVDDQQKFAGIISSECQRLVKFSDDLMINVSLQGSYSPVQDPVNLEHTLNKVIKDHYNQFESKKISCKLNNPDNYIIKGDSFLIEKAVSNIINNAIKFSPTNSNIDLNLSADKEWIKIEVRDYGLGVPDWAKDKIFQQFFSLPQPDNNQRSSGLGLSMVQEIMRIHRGKITLANCQEKGCLVTLYFPRTNS